MHTLSLFFSALGIVISLIIYTFSFRKYSTKSSLYLSLIYFITGLYGTTHYFMYEPSNLFITAILFNNFVPLYASIGPLVYLYTKSTLNDNTEKIDNRFLIYLLPFIIFFLDIAPYLFSSFAFKLETVKAITLNSMQFGAVRHLFFTDQYSTFFRQLVNFIYIISALILLIRNKIKQPISISQLKLIKRWLYFLLISHTIINVAKMTESITKMNALHYPILNGISNNLLYTSWIFYAAFVLAILYYPNILYSLPQDKVTTILDEIEASQENQTENDKIEKKTYKAFELSNDYILKIEKVINDYILKKPYVEDKFGLSVLTSETRIPTHHLNYFFKEHLNTNFNHWKNDLKIKHSCALIEEGKLDDITIEALALQCGFKSYSHFFTVFKEHTNTTPSEYVYTIKNGSN